MVCLVYLPRAAAVGQTEPISDEQPLWSAAWITDTQTPECGWITSLCQRLTADRPSMVIHTGDTRFEWVNQCAWKDIMTLMNSGNPPLELHVAPGNHDLTNHVLKAHLRRAASRGIYRVDTGQLASDMGYYHNRVTADAQGDLWPAWNPEVVAHPAWQPDAEEKQYRYVFKRGGIRFILCDCYYSDEQRDWVRNLITQPDDSSVTIILQHKHEVDALAKYVEGLEGKHNVKLVLSGDHHIYCYEERHGVTFITSAGVANGHYRDADAMTLKVYPDRLQLDRYLIPEGAAPDAISGPETIWTCAGEFKPYERPTFPPIPSPPSDSDSESSTTLSENLIYNGHFDNGIWYERYRGWSPAGWYQWFTCGDDAPEHTVGNDKPHSGKEYVRIHMWAHAWRGGILQNVHNVKPGHWYRLTAYGWFAKTADDPQPHARVGLDPAGGLREQFGVDVTKHPAPPYNECVGDDPRTPDPDWPDLPESTVWSPFLDHLNDWGRFEVTAEATSDVASVVLYCDPVQRGADKPIYEMNWDSVSLHEIPWPTRRIADSGEVLPIDNSMSHIVVNVLPEQRSAQVTWRTKLPAGASQVLYRFLDSEAVSHQPAEQKEPKQIAVDTFPFESPVVYEDGVTSHWIEIQDLGIPEAAIEMQAVILSRVTIDGAGRTLCSPMERITLK